jgi:SAM-dependent methyltransferase
VQRALAAPTVVDRFAAARRLTPSYGIGLDERVVEYPWLLSRRPSGRVLDAGSTLNHAHVLDCFLPLFSSLHVVTLTPEERSYTERGVSYVYADLRDLPFRDSYYDTVVSISTLEHIGMNNVRYGATGAEPSAEPRRAMLAALTELRRVLAPGGLFLATVPYGRAEAHGWFRQFDRGDVEDLVAGLDARSASVDVFEYSRSGWQRSALARAAQARYRDSTGQTEPGEDFAVAARAVACISARL